MRILLSDQQIEFEAGQQTIYTAIALRIQTPQGLDAGNISFPWEPEQQELTVHKLLIQRGDKMIDVLASGQTFTVVRRETNLESAMLDGVLTANIQPEGLQVGDVVEFAASIKSRDPVMKGHVEAITATWNGTPISRAHFKARWPSNIPVRIRQIATMPALKPIKANGGTTAEITYDHLEPILPPKGAPLRYRMGRMIEMTDFASWADIGALMTPLYQKAAVLPAEGPLRSEAERIRALSPDQKVQAEAALSLVQNRIRYVALMMGVGGYVPAEAAATWGRRYGDCKGKSVLLLTILHALNIEAQPVLVSTALGDGLDERLPLIGAFDHVIVRAKIGGKTYWMDGTRTGDTSLDRLTTPAFGWGLPLVERGAALVRMIPVPLESPNYSTSIRIDATKGLTVPAPAKVETVIRGDAALATNAGLANLAGAARDRALRDYWKGQHDFIDVTAASATFDAKTGEQRLTMEGRARMDWSSGFYETDGTALGYKADFARDSGPDRDAPFAVAYPFFNRTVETILLPPGFPDIKPGGKNDVDRTVAGVEYRRHVTLAKGVFTVDKTERSIVPEFAAKDAPAAQIALRDMAEQTLYIRRPSNYQPTEAELALSLAETPKTADAYVERGNTLLDRGRYDEAVKDFDAALAIDPKHALALADRGITNVQKSEFAAATKDLDAALAIDPRSAVVYRGRGLMAAMQDKPKDAITAYTKSLQFEPNNAFALGRRAFAYHASGDEDAALTDAAAAIEVNPNWPELYLLRANIFRGKGQSERVAHEASAVVAANPDNVYAYVASANLYSALGRKEDAMRAYDRALMIKPEAFIYLNRRTARPKSDKTGRLADVDAALKLEPKNIYALAAKAQTLRDVGDVKGAIASYNAAMAIAPKNNDLLVGRGILRVRSGDVAGGERDLSAARFAATQAEQLNNLCWAKATAGVLLESARADCEAAIAKAPGSAAYDDSMGFVLLRLGRIDESIAAYDRSLKSQPMLGPSLYGRGVALSRKGDKAKSAADLAAALKVYPEAAEDFAEYGVTP
ncbi:tetratricopeptide repeat protein [Sphingomonas sp. SUN019]|uniref:tetratricopeptide repeat protein n=1 Tax=Sphingomonas sp. SUN019 TaxID=2937788 RepID=UPI00216405B1|nr:tetratricopeptide repeat protein [Sphingomonas sp. SUN019]UVO51718.1 tetratricopeptide repeat protein [Sphingomonas sp. SUN019]